MQAKCNEGFYGGDCTSYCPPPGLRLGLAHALGKELHCFRDNFVCTSNGRQCLPGWTGVDCKEPVCEKECRNGKCVAPNTCRYKHDFLGKLFFESRTSSLKSLAVPLDGPEIHALTAPPTRAARTDTARAPARASARRTGRVDSATKLWTSALRNRATTVAYARAWCTIPSCVFAQTVSQALPARTRYA